MKKIFIIVMTGLVLTLMNNSFTAQAGDINISPLAFSPHACQFIPLKERVILKIFGEPIAQTDSYRDEMFGPKKGIQVAIDVAESLNAKLAKAIKYKRNVEIGMSSSMQNNRVFSVEETNPHSPAGGILEPREPKLKHLSEKHFQILMEAYEELQKLKAEPAVN